MPRDFKTNANLKSRQEFQIITRGQKLIDEIKTPDGKRTVKLGSKSGAAVIDDAAVAREIHETVGQGGTGDVLVVPTESKPDPLHPRTFYQRKPMPWHNESFEFGKGNTQ